MNPYINTAVKVARRAAVMMLRAANDLTSIKVEKKAYNDYVSEVDKIAEEIIISGITAVFPTHKIRSEESGIHGNPAAEFEWIIDPLDGTTNFLHHHPQYAISLALAERGKLIAAVIFAPERNDLYIAGLGQGAFLNDKRMRVSKREKLNECLIGTGFPVVNQSITPVYLELLGEILAKTAGARREGAASLDLCNVALGRFDGFFEFNLKPWDVAAGALIVQEAGGLVTDPDGNGTWLESGNIVAGNPRVLGQLLQIIQTHPDTKKSASN